MQPKFFWNNFEGKMEVTQNVDCIFHGSDVLTLKKNMEHPFDEQEVNNLRVDALDQTAF